MHVKRRPEDRPTFTTSIPVGRPLGRQMCRGGLMHVRRRPEDRPTILFD